MSKEMKEQIEEAYREGYKDGGEDVYRLENGYTHRGANKSWEESFTKKEIES